MSWPVTDQLPVADRSSTDVPVTLWRLVKHHRLPVTAYANFTALRENVTAILNTVGLDYRVSFV